MTDDRKKGWHPDPYGHHYERFYFADNQPGRLVRDQYLHESFDDIPGDHLQLPQPDPKMFGMLPVRELATRSFGPSDGELPVAVDQDSAVEPLAVAASDVAWIDPPSTGWIHAYHHFTMPSRRVLASAVGGGLALVLIVVLVTTLGSGGGGSPAHGVRASIDRSSDTLPPAGDPSTSSPGGDRTAWQVTSTYTGSSVGLNGVSCASSSVCMATGRTQSKGGAMFRSGDGGSSWTSSPLPAGTAPLVSVSCPAVATCVAVGDNSAVTTTSSGLQWTSVRVGQGALTTVACASSSVCVAGGSLPTKATCGNGGLYATRDGGQHWITSPQRCFVPTSVACPSTSRCEAVGFTLEGTQQYGEILVSHDAGAHWQLQTKLSDAGSAMTGVTCQSTSVCEAVGSSNTQPILGTLNGGATWTPQRLPSGVSDAHLTAIGCGSLLVCQAVGNGAQFSTKDGGQTWTPQPAPAPVDALKDVSCPSVDLCAAVSTAPNQGESATLKLSL